MDLHFLPGYIGMLQVMIFGTPCIMLILWSQGRNVSCCLKIAELFGDLILRHFFYRNRLSQVILVFVLKAILEMIPVFPTSPVKLTS